MTSSSLKIIACLSMVIDHVGMLFFPNIIVFRIIGRIAYPMFCFVLVEGYVYTSNVKKYLTRLLIFAFISEIPFDIATTGTIYNIGQQNVFFTLFLGLVALYIYDVTTTKVYAIIYVIILATINNAINADYGFVGVIFLLVFYIFRDKFILMGSVFLL